MSADAIAETKGSETALARTLRASRLIVCVGTGGVGKTTIAAALGLAAARVGRRTLVLTIDPARRLANAFGRDEVGSEPVRVELAAEPGDGDPPSEPSLEIMMLSTRRAFDQLVFRLTRDQATRERILGNRIYHHLAEALAGSSEYAAMAEVQALVESGQYDLIVVDTPPAEHALDFLRAPGRIQAFLDSRFFHGLVRPAMTASRFSLRLFSGTFHRALGLLERIAGVGFLEDLTELLRALDGLADDLSSRARRIEEVLFGADTRFVLICRALAGSERTTGEFMTGIGDMGAPLGAVVVNRLQPWPLAEDPAELLSRCRGEALERDVERLAASLAAAGKTAAADDDAAPSARQASSAADPSEAARNVTDAVLEHARACALEQRRFRALEQAAASRGIDCLRITERSEPLDRLEGLEAIAQQLTGTS